MQDFSHQQYFRSLGCNYPVNEFTFHFNLLTLLAPRPLLKITWDLSPPPRMPINHQDSYHWIPTEAFIFHWKTGVLTGSKKWPLSEFGTCWLGGLSHPSQNSKEEKTHVSVSEKKFERTKSPPRNASFLLETIDFYRGPKILKWRYIDHDISIPRVSCFFLFSCGNEIDRLL